jgi:hypothetical protein
MKTLQEQISRMKSMMGIITEDNEFYDRILDLYSEVGIEGLSKDEIDYLKSGGQTELPSRYKSEISQEKYNDFVKGSEMVELKTSDWQDIFELQKIIDDSSEQVYATNNFDDIGFFLWSLCSLVFPKNEEIIKRLKKLNNYNPELSVIKDDKYQYVILKSYLEHLSGLDYKIIPPQ